MVEDTVDWDWDENVDDDIDFVEIENEHGQKVYAAQRITSLRHRYYSETSELDSEGTEYPVDIWFQISKYIRPEDVGRFAGICQATLFVTRSANFWFHMYKKYFKKSFNVPERLQPDHMRLRYGLRLCVIRYLYLTYMPLMIQAHISNFYTPKALLKRRCLSVWYKKFKTQWIFFFKLKLVNHIIDRNRHVDNHQKSIFKVMDDIMANPEEDCKTLKVICDGFQDAPPVMGMYLNIIYTKVASDMRHNHLYLGFSPNLQDNIKTQEHNMTLINVYKMEVLDWWHPDYPHSSAFLPSSTMTEQCTQPISSMDF